MEERKRDSPDPVLDDDKDGGDGAVDESGQGAEHVEQEEEDLDGVRVTFDIGASAEEDADGEYVDGHPHRGAHHPVDIVHLLHDGAVPRPHGEELEEETELQHFQRKSQELLTALKVASAIETANLMAMEP